MATIRQQNRLKIIGKNRTKKAELLAAGYALSTATDQPKSVMKAKGWKELTDKYLPDDELLGVHKRKLYAKKQIGAQILIQHDGVVLNKDDEGMIEVDDNMAQLKALELGYKVKGYLKDVNLNQFNMGEMTLQFIRDDASKTT